MPAGLLYHIQRIIKRPTSKNWGGILLEIVYEQE